MKHLLPKPILTRLSFFISAVLFTLLIIPQIFAQGSGKAVSFDGTNDYVNIPDNSAIHSLSAVTIEMWFKCTGASINFLCAKAIEQLEIHTTNSNGIRFIPTTRVYLDSPNDAFIPGQWVHLACVYDPSQSLGKIYINGNDVSAVNNGSNPITTAITTSSNSFRLGLRSDNYYPYQGQIDEVRIWNLARTQDEIQANMCKKLTGSEANLVGYWRLDDGSGTNANDETANNNDGTLTNGPTWGWSGAAIGDASAYDYTGTNPGDFSVNLAHTNGDDITATGDGGTVSGIQVYRVDETSMRTGATAPNENWIIDPLRFWGVFIAGTSPTYTLSYNYDGYPGITDESDLDLAARDNLSDDSWTDANAILNTTANTLTLTGQTGTEYAPGSQTGANPLPVGLNTFSAAIVKEGIKLSWQTETEVNNYGFDIERSTDKQNWTKLGFVTGNGNSNSPKDYSYVDEDIKNQTNGKYYYRLKQIDTDGSYKYSETIEVDWTNGVTDVNDDSNLPKEFSLSQNYPNPFNPTTTINYRIPEQSFVNIKVYNMLGEVVALLVNENKGAGNYSLHFDGSDLPSGTYLYKIQAGDYYEVKKMVLIK
ncbi:MAG: hypothetical protein STSR0008_22260 [Ignavibacterium sp.]